MKDENNVVICVDNCFSGNKSNIQVWLNHPRFEFIRHDVTTELQLEVDQIYHLACPASPVFYQNNGIRTIKTSVLGTLNMLGLAKRLNARILFTSTSEVYGDPDVHPQVEEYNGNVNPIGIRRLLHKSHISRMQGRPFDLGIGREGAGRPHSSRPRFRSTRSRLTCILFISLLLLSSAHQLL